MSCPFTESERAAMAMRVAMGVPTERCCCESGDLWFSGCNVCKVFPPQGAPRATRFMRWD